MQPVISQRIGYVEDLRVGFLWIRGCGLFSIILWCFGVGVFCIAYHSSICRSRFASGVVCST